MPVFKIDENLPEEVAARLRSAGHDALTVQDQSLAGAGDASVAEVCRAERRALVTLDLDFANIRAYPPEDFPGIVVMRLVRQDKPSVLAAFEQVVATLGAERLAQRLWIVEEHRIRVFGGI